MSLFDWEFGNLFLCDGNVVYYGKVFLDIEVDWLLECLLMEIFWENDCVVIFGKEFIMKRKVVWYVSSYLSYMYFNMIKIVLIFIELLE